MTSRKPKSLKPFLADYDGIFSQDTLEHCVKITKQQNELISGLIQPWAWLTRWSSPSGQNLDPNAISQLITDLEYRLQVGLAGESECNDCNHEDCPNCVTYRFDQVDTYDLFEFHPVSPLEGNWVGEFPYLFNPWNVTQTPELGGIKAGDLLVSTSALIIAALNPFDIASLLPSVAFWVSGAETVELEMIERAQGGFAVLSVDGRIQEFLDVQSFEFGEIETWIDALEDVYSALSGDELLGEIFSVKLEMPDLGLHRVALTFVPRISISLIPIGIGGGIRSVTVCGENAELAILPELRVVGCQLEYRQSPNQPWIVLHENICGENGADGQNAPIPVFAWQGTQLTIDADADGNVDVTSPDLKGDTGADGECPDCGETPPITDEDKLEPDYLERVCGGALLLADATIDGYKAALQEAIDGVNGGNIPLSAYQMAQGALAAVVLSSAVSGQWYATAGAAAGMIALKAYYDDAPSVPELQQYQADIEAIRETAKEVLYCQIAANGEFTQNLYYLWLAGLSVAINQSVPFELVGGNLIQWDLAIEIYYKGWLENPSTACAGYCAVEVEADYCKYFDLTTQTARDAFTLTTGTKLSTGFRATQSGVNEYWVVEAELDQAWIGELMQFDLELDIIADAPTTPDYIQGVYNGFFLDAPYPSEEPVSYKTNDGTPLATSTTNKQFRFKLAYRDGLPFGEENPTSNRFLVTGVRIKFNAASDPWPTIPNC